MTNSEEALEADCLISNPASLSVCVGTGAISASYFLVCVEDNGGSLQTFVRLNIVPKTKKNI